MGRGRLLKWEKASYGLHRCRTWERERGIYFVLFCFLVCLKQVFKNKTEGSQHCGAAHEALAVTPAPQRSTSWSPSCSTSETTPCYHTWKSSGRWTKSLGHCSLILAQSWPLQRFWKWTSVWKISVCLYLSLMLPFFSSNNSNFLYIMSTYANTESETYKEGPIKSTTDVDLLSYLWVLDTTSERGIMQWFTIILSMQTFEFKKNVCRSC